MGARERIGAWLGRACAPATAFVSRVRHGRMFHPEGWTYSGICEVAADDASFAPLATALEGRVLARFSGALWRHERERFDVLGCALRFRRGPGAPLDHVAEVGDTDLLTATIRSPLTMLLSPFATNAHDFVHARYWAVSPFEHAAVRFELRLSPVERAPHAHPAPRAAQLARAVATGAAAWWLEARRTLHLRWHRVGRILLLAPARVDQEALRFDPFRGVLRPVGLVHAMRRATYASSQAARRS
ncbi:MAG: hypothetical protein KF773_32330 [Deltaproteobacteria bacterium]|nr:hypothetical protein [Deltaproteobacteria bacterium]